MDEVLGIETAAAPVGEPFAGVDQILSAPTAEVVEIEVLCPACGAPDPVVEMVEDAEVAKCGSCGCDFCPGGVQESFSKRMIRSLNSKRQRRFKALNAVDTRQALPPPTKGYAFLNMGL